MKHLANKLSAMAAVVFLTAVGATAQECYTPLEWIPKNYVSNLDRNKNFVDDVIDQMNPDEAVDVILCLNACAREQDYARFEEMGLAISYRSPYLSILYVEGISVADAIMLGQDERVAMVEFAHEAAWTNDVGMRAARIRASGTYANTVESAYPALSGSGINIAIMDSGVDNIPSGGGTGHEAFPATKYVAGYDAVSNVEMDPDDDHGHGTHVAGIALGTGGVSGTYRGAAPGAGLVDIRIGGIGGVPIPAILRGYDKIIERRVAWNIKVVNMSFRVGFNSNGTDAHSQMVNRIVREGVFVAVAASNSGPGNDIPAPAASDFALTVASAYDQATITRTDDAISIFSSRGPRLNDGDGMTTDEQKPDVTAYGENIHSAQHNSTAGYVDMSGTSMASPQAAGLAALILEANPGMDPLSVKNLIESTAEDFGTTGWDIEFGHGIINGYEAINQVVASLKSDLAFDVYCHKPGTSPYWWQSPDVVPQNASIIEGTANGVTVTVRNNGPNPVSGAKVRVGIYNFSNSTADFDICLHNVPTLGVGSTYSFTCPWTPEADGVPPGTVHACLKAYIIYNYDSNPSNNCAQHNVNITQTHSPALFNMTVVNPTGRDLEMEIVTDPPAEQIRRRGWVLTMDEQNFTMGANDCPKTVTIAVEANGARFGDKIPVTIVVRGREGGQGEFIDLGGVQIIAENADGTPRPADEKIFRGIRHTSLGQARLRSTPGELILSDMDGGGDDGVRIHLGEADFWQGTLKDFDPDVQNDGDYVLFIPMSNDWQVNNMRITDEADHAQFSVSYETGPALTIDVYDNGELVATDISTDGIFANVWPSLAGMQVTPYRRSEDEVYSEVVFSGDVQIEVLGQGGGNMVTGDRIVARCAAGDVNAPDYLTDWEIYEDGLAYLVLTDEAGGLYERPFRAMGNPVLEWRDAGQVLTASRATARSTVGARAEVPELDSYDLFWTETDISDVPTGTHLYVTARGNLDGIGQSDLGSARVMRDVGDVKISADLVGLGVGSCMVEVYSGGGLVYSGGGFDVTMPLGSVNNWPHGGGHAIDEATGGPSFRLYWPGDAEFVLADGWTGNGDEVRIIPEGAPGLIGVTELGVHATGLDQLVIISEEASSSLPVSVGTPGAELPFSLHQNYPNPFDQRTVFRFDLFSAAYVELEVFNLLGEKVAGVLSRQMASGTHEVEWKRPATSLASGTYIYKLKVRPVNNDQTFEMQRQMLILD